MQGKALQGTSNHCVLQTLMQSSLNEQNWIIKLSSKLKLSFHLPPEPASKSWGLSPSQNGKDECSGVWREETLSVSGRFQVHSSILLHGRGGKERGEIDWLIDYCYFFQSIESTHKDRTIIWPRSSTLGITLRMLKQ